MNELLFFIIGLFIGVLMGVFIMCLCIISKKDIVKLNDLRDESYKDKTN